MKKNTVLSTVLAVLLLLSFTSFAGSISKSVTASNPGEDNTDYTSQNINDGSVTFHAEAIGFGYGEGHASALKKEEADAYYIQMCGVDTHAEGLLLSANAGPTAINGFVKVYVRALVYSGYGSGFAYASATVSW